MGLGAIGSIANTFLANKQFKYQKELNERQMQREDNAVQRRAADLEAAGLSKTLAAGSAASTTPGTAGPAPQVDTSFVNDAYRLASDLAQQRANIGNTEANEMLLRAKARAQEQQTGFDMAEEARKQEKHMYDMYNQEWYKRRGMPHGFVPKDPMSNFLVAKTFYDYENSIAGERDEMNERSRERNLMRDRADVNRILSDPNTKWYEKGYAKKRDKELRNLGY